MKRGALEKRRGKMPQQNHTAGKGKIRAALRAAIPQRVSSRAVLWAMEVMRRGSRVPKGVIERNHEKNLQALADSSIFDPPGLIENQACWERVQFGCGKHHNMKYSGCEIIATCNALMTLGQKGSTALMADLISCYERDGSLRRGEFGVSAGAVRDFFLENGYEVCMIIGNDWEAIEALGRKRDVLIATAYNDQWNIMAGVHTVCVTREKNGRYAVHNAYCWSGARYVARDGGRGGYETLRQAIGVIHEGAAPIAVMGIGDCAQSLEICSHFPLL